MTTIKSEMAFKVPLKKRIAKRKYLYIMLIPVVAYFIIFKYIPMWGLLISFQDYNVFKGVFHSEWIGFENFIDFFTGRYFGLVMRNTLLISLVTLAIGFPLKVIFALMLNELKHMGLKRSIQTITYMPHFLSSVVIISMISVIFSPTNGMINHFIELAGGDPIFFMGEKKYFYPLYIGSEIWQATGWGSIIFLAAISNIDPQLYEAARIDGASRFRQMLHITIPSILGTMAVMLILSLGRVLNIGFEKIYLMQNAMNREITEVISTYVYTRGVLNSDFGYSTAVGFFQSFISLFLVVGANMLSKKLFETSLW